MFHLGGADPLLVLATILVAGVGFGSLAKRLRLPSVTGQILAGILLGRAGLEVFDESAAHGLQPLTHFALGLMAVTVGAHLNLRRMRNAGKRLLYLLVAEATITPLLIFVLIRGLTDIPWSGALLFGTIAVSTAPATVVALVRETRSRGVFVKTLVAAVALNNVVCIFLFEVARVAARQDLGLEAADALDFVVGPAGQILKAAALGAAGAGTMLAMHRLDLGRHRITTAATITILLTSGVASYVDVSPLLACLFLGFLQANLSPDREEVVDSVFTDFQPAILAIFFTLAGMELTLEHADKALAVSAVLFTGRIVGKLAAANVAMRLAGATEKVRRFLGPALTPQAGLAVGLVILFQEDPELRESAGEFVELFAAAVLTTVVANEIVGPLLTRHALARAGEAGKDRLRLIDFIQEENIQTGFQASDMEDAIDQLTDLLVRSHQLPDSEREVLKTSVLEREAQVSTCLGRGLAVPHGVLTSGKRMLGVMALSEDGLGFETPDGVPVHCLVLLATPQNERDRHLQVLAALARTVGTDGRFRRDLFGAESPAHAYELLHDEEAESFNYFLDDPAT